VLTWHRPYSLRGRPYRTRGGTRACHVSGIFGIFGMHFDQLEGDTCHHWMGDTWHQDDVSILRGRLTWHADSVWTFDDVDVGVIG
jgi:hypothetical protein